MARDKTRMKRKERKNIATGVAHVNSSFNNTKILISDVQGNAISWSSAGTMGFKGSRKSTPYAAQMAAEDAGKKAQEHGVRTLEVERHAEFIAGSTTTQNGAPWVSHAICVIVGSCEAIWWTLPFESIDVALCNLLGWISRTALFATWLDTTSEVVVSPSVMCARAPTSSSAC